MNVSAISFLILLLILFCVCFPLSIHCCLTLYRDRNKLYVLKRHRFLVFIEIGSINIAQFTYLTAYSIEILIRGIGTFSDYYILLFILIPSICLFIIVSTLRIWLLYYDIHLSHLHLQKAWLDIMDPNLESQNWFKKYEHSFGNANYLLKYGILMVFLLSILNIILRTFKLLFIERVATWGASLIVTIGAAFIWHKLKHYHYDTLGIRQEMSLVIKFGFTFIMFALTLVILYQSNVIPFKVYDIIWCYNMLLLLTGLTVTSTLIPKKMSNSDNHDNLDYITNTNKCIKCCQKTKFFFNGKTKPSSETTNENKNEDKISPIGQDSGMTLEELPRLDMKSLSQSGSSQTNILSNVIRSRSPTAASMVSSNALNDNFGQRWLDIVCIPFGYEALMTHLESEFAIENLLFISEYMQLKNVLKDHFSSVMTSIMENNRNTRFNVILPNYDDHNRANGIPMSSIVKKLNQSIIDLSSKRDALPTSHPIKFTGSNANSQNSIDLNDKNENENENENDFDLNKMASDESSADLMPIDSISSQTGQSIVNTFVELYTKYIGYSSEFEINIKSDTRHRLQIMLDSHFFAMWSINSEHKAEKALLKQPSVDQVTVWDKIKYESMIHWKIGKANSTINVIKQIETYHKSLMHAEFEKYIEITPNLTQSQLLQWLLSQLIENMELAVCEISRLMNDSFSRFRKNSNVFQKVLHLAKEYHNN